MDFAGPCAPTDKGRKYYILTVVDEFSGYPWAFAASSATTEVVIKGLTQVFSMIGVPKRVKSDNGAAFRSRAMVKWLQMLGIQQQFGPVYHPQS